MLNGQLLPAMHLYRISDCMLVREEEEFCARACRCDWGTPVQEMKTYSSESPRRMRRMQDRHLRPPGLSIP